MTETLIGYARCSTDRQDLTAQRQALAELGVAPERIYMDKGLTGTNRARPGLDQAMAAVRKGDTLVVSKLDRLARSVPDARHIADQLEAKGVKLALGRNIHDPTDPMGKMFFNILATFAEFEADLITDAHAGRDGHRPGQRQVAGQTAQALRKAATGTLPHARHRRLFHRRSGGSFRRIETHRLPDDQPRRRFLMTIPYGAIYRQKIVPFSVESHIQMPPQTGHFLCHLSVSPFIILTTRSCRT